ncbi:MAG: FAD-dependent oxidoreductase [Pseudomonadota bacterium]
MEVKDYKEQISKQLIKEKEMAIKKLKKSLLRGDFQGRARFGLEVVRAVRAAVPAGFPILARVNGNDLVPGGIGREELVRFARALVQEGVCALDMNVGWHESQVPQIGAEVPAAAFAYLARGFKEAVTVPVIAGHRIDDPDLARRLIRDGTCDAVAMGRALIADPDLPRKAREGREGHILHCVACGQGCLDAIFHLRSVRCLANPQAGQERRRVLAPVAEPARVVVVGGGAAGLSAAAAAAERGFEVTLFERTERLGGQLHLAGAPPGRAPFLRLAAELAARVRHLGVQVRLGQEADVAAVLAEAPRHVILATGSRPVLPAIPGAERPSVLQAWDVLAGRAQPGRQVVVIGGNAVGVEVALQLAEEGALDAESVRFLLVHGADDPESIAREAARGARGVTVVELAPKLGVDLGKSTRWGMLQDVERAGIGVRLGTRAVAIEEGGVRAVVGLEGDEVLLPADTVVLALGARPHNPLQVALEAAGVTARVVGDAARVADALKAIHAGYEVAQRL